MSCRVSIHCINARQGIFWFSFALFVILFAYITIYAHRLEKLQKQYIIWLGDKNE